MATNKALPPKIRLAGPGVQGAEVFNYYQLISLISSLYVKAMDRHDEDVYAGAWDTCSVTTLEQIGIAHQCWGLVQASTCPPKENILLIKRTLTVVHRLLTLDEKLTEWTALSRWTRILLLMEHEMKKLGQSIAIQNPAISEQLESMNHGYQARIALLMEMHASAMKEEQALNQNYAEPVAL